MDVGYLVQLKATMYIQIPYNNHFLVSHKQ